MNKLLNYTWIGWLNIIVLQWLFVRFYYAENEQGRIEGWGLLFPIVPLTGWWNDYVPQKHWTVKL